MFAGLLSFIGVRSRVPVIVARPPAPPLPAETRRDAAPRDRMYAVVRDAMAASGLLTSTYRFKVLSLGSSGIRFSVLMNLNQELGEGIRQQLFIESVIKRLAATRYQLQVDTVYWHAAEALALRSRKSATAGSQRPEIVPTPRGAENSVAPVEPQSQVIRLSDVPSDVLDRLLSGGDNNSNGSSGFEETRAAGPDSDFDPQVPRLSDTQYGLLS